MAAGTFYDVTWGSVRLWCASVTTDNSRTQVIHELAEGDDHPTQDRGLAPRRVTCELLFVEMPAEATPPLERFRAFKAQIDSKEGARLFVHPIDGAYYASVEAFSYTLDEDGNLADVSCTFVKAKAADGPTPTGAGTSIRSGEDAVAARAAELAAELEAVGLSSAVGDEAIAKQAAWQEAETVPTRQVIVDVAELSGKLADLIEVEGLEHDLALFGAYKAAILFGASLRAAALSALAETPKLTAIRIGRPISVLALCARLYGGAQAEDRERQIRALNDLRTPGWLPAGAVVMAPIPTSAGGSR